MSQLPTEPRFPWLASHRNEFGLMAAIASVLIITLLFNQDYLADPARNIRDILHQTSLLGIFALGAAIVIIAGGIDLSSGSVIVFSGSVCGLTMLLLAPTGANGLPDARDVGLPIVALALCMALLAGFLVGAVHAWLVTVIKLPPFVATLASLVGLRSLSKLMNQAVTRYLGDQKTRIPMDDVTFEHLKQWWVALIVFLALSGFCWFLLNRTVIGRHLYALGGNEQAARLSGVRTHQLKWLAYCLGSMTASIAGVLYVAKIGSANPSTLAVGYELNAIAAAVVGGCSLQGGVGMIPGVMLGVLFLQIVIDAVAKVVREGSDDYQGLIVGVLVVMAVAFTELQQAKGRERVQLFPGALGWCVVPTLSLLAALVAFILAGPSTGGGVGLLTFTLLATIKLLQARPRRPATVSARPSA